MKTLFRIAIFIIFTTSSIKFSYSQNILNGSFENWTTFNLTYASGNIIDTNSWVGLGSVLKIDSLNLSYKSTITDLEVLMPSGNFNMCVGNTHQQITILLKNVGNTKISSGQIIDIYNLIDANPLVAEKDTLHSDFFPNDTISYTFLQLMNLSAMGPHTYKFYLNYNGDTIHFNDTTSGIATHTSQITINIVGADTIYLPSSNFPDTLRLSNSYLSYSWKNSTGTLLSTDSVLIINSYGWYYIDVDNNYGCKTSDSVLVDVPTKINDLPGHYSNINIFPNPGKGILKIIINEPVNLNYIIEITDIQGKILKKFNLNKNIVTLNLTELERGIYFLNFITGKENRVEKLIIQ